jgi:hypothetical protein
MSFPEYCAHLSLCSASEEQHILQRCPFTAQQLFDILCVSSLRSVQQEVAFLVGLSTFVEVWDD